MIGRRLSRLGLRASRKTTIDRLEKFISTSRKVTVDVATGQQFNPKPYMGVYGTGWDGVVVYSRYERCLGRSTPTKKVLADRWLQHRSGRKILGSPMVGRVALKPLSTTKAEWTVTAVDKLLG